MISHNHRQLTLQQTRRAAAEYAARTSVARWANWRGRPLVSLRKSTSSPADENPITVATSDRMPPTKVIMSSTAIIGR